MLAVQLDELDLFDAWYEGSTEFKWRAQFPTAAQPEMASLGTVYFELEPGESLAEHTDSKDEIVVLLSGSGEGNVGGEIGRLTAPGMVFIPADIPHGFKNTGDEKLRALGVFAGSDVVSRFELDVMPIGIRVFGEQPAGVDS
jgi:quercetin dioxygenase-like cupin family protein